MRGEIEIYRGDELLYHDNNMIVEGAAKTLADIMTLSPSLSGIEDHGTSSILDTSNYTIQAISFGKDLDTFSKHGHIYPSVRNITYTSTFSSTTDLGRDYGVGLTSDEYLIESRPDLPNPPGFESVPSSVAHVVHVVDKTTDKVFYISDLINLRNSSELDVIPSGFQDSWWCYSWYIKKDTDYYPPRWDTVTDPSRLEFKLTARSPDSYTAGGTSQFRGISRNSLTVEFFESGEVSATDITTFDSDQRNNLAGFTEEDWKGTGGVQAVGDGWYRMWTSVPAPSGCDQLNAQLYPVGYAGPPNYGELSGGLFIFGLQAEAGRWPTELQFNEFGRKVNAWDLSASPLSQRYEYSEGAAPTVLDKGTVRVVTDPDSAFYASSLNVKNALGEGPNPESTRLESKSILPSTVSGTFTRLDFGQNPNYVPFRSWSSTDYNFSAYDEKLQYVKDIYLPKHGDKGTPSIGNMGNHAFFLGCYPEGSSTGGSTYAMVSSLESSAAYANPIHTGTYNGTFNEASSMDHLGFVNMIMSSVPNGTYQMSSTSSGLCVSAPGAPVYQAPAYLEYSVTIGSGDVGYSNLYGGITKMAMWTIDVPESLKAGNTPPYVFRTLNNPRKYRMFCTKHFQQNICKVNDFGGRAGADQYDDLLIKWRLHFL